MGVAWSIDTIVSGVLPACHVPYSSKTDSIRYDRKQDTASVSPLSQPACAGDLSGLLQGNLPLQYAAAVDLLRIIFLQEGEIN